MGEKPWQSRTLCNPCHKKVTKELAARRAEHRRQEKKQLQTLTVSPS
jgi:5-methylcytosine-specific restriction endonuclease McrA